MSLLTARWSAHPWLTGAEVAAFAAFAVELVLLGHVALGWLWGVITHDPDAMVYTRFVFLTGEDAKFASALVALCAVAPLAILLALLGAVGAGWAAHAGAPVRPFTEAGVAGVGLLVFGAALLLGSKALGGGILPR